MSIDPKNRNLFSAMEPLEERVLFDAVPDCPVFAQPDAEQAPPVQAQVQQEADPSFPTELIVIDAAVENSQALLDAILVENRDKTFEIQILNSRENGFSQITDLLADSESKYDAIHILSHGDEGEVHLGSDVITADNIHEQVIDLTQWSDSLSDGADLLFYGCDLAGNADGQELLETISAATGADVAASDDVTGNIARNGDWELEFIHGNVQSDTLAASSWQGTLAVEATDGIVTIQDAENSSAGTITLTNNGAPEVVTVLDTPSRVGQMLERVWQFNETADTGSATYVFDVSGVAGINGLIASDFGLIISDQPDLADGPGTTTLVASGYDAVNGLVFFHQVDLDSGDFFGLATEVVLDNFSINPTATGLEDTPIDLGLELSDSLTDGGVLQDIIGTDAGFRASTAGTTTTDFFIPAGTTAIRITGFSTRDIGTGANDALNDDYQFLNASIDLATETSNGYIGHIVDQGPNRSDQFAFEDAPLGQSVLTGGGTIVGDANDNIDPTFDIVNGVLQITENHQLQTAYHVEYLTNATSSSEFIRTESAVLESGDQSLATLTIPPDADFLVVNINDAQADSNFAIEYKGNSRVYIDLATLRASGVVAAQQGETDNRVVSYAFEDYDVSSAGVGSILSAAGSVVGDTTGQTTVINDNQIYIDANGDLVIDRNNAFASDFNSLITVEYYDRRDAGSSAEQLGESSAFGFFESDPSNPISTLEFDIPENATLGLLNLTFNGTSNSDTNENSGAAFAVIDLVNETSSGSIYFVRTSNIADLVGFDSVSFGTAFFDDPNSISNHNTINQFNDPFAGTAEFNLINGGTTLEFAANSNSGANQSFRDYFAGAQIEWFGAAPFEISGFTNGGSFSQGTFNPVTGNWELTIAEAQAGLAYIPPTHVSGTVPVDVTLRIGDESEVTSVTVQAVIDPISFMAPDACGHEDTDISILDAVTPVFVDQDGSETVTSQVLSGIPIGHTLTDGTNVFVSSAGNQSVDITAWDFTSITYRANPNESGTFTITMDVDWQDVGGGVTDTDSLQTTFDVVVKPLNDPPVAVDDFYTVLGNNTLTVNAANGVLNNDSDVDGDMLTVTGVVSGPTVGSVMLNPDGSFTYTPPTGFSGTASFDYEVTDGNGGFTTATAFIDVSEPVTGPLDAMDDMVTTNEETLINIDVMNNDDLPTTGAFNIQSTTPPSNGSITVLPDGTIDYTPDPDFFGTDTFTYTLADASGRTSTATVTVTVVNVQDPPVANADSGSTPEDTTLPNIDILSNDSDPDNDMLTVTMATAPNGTVAINPDGTIDYTPDPGFNGIDIVTYTISDGNGGFATSTVQINVVPVADPPTSADNTVTLDEDSSYTFAASDFAFADQDLGDSLVAVRIDTAPTDGTLLLNGNPIMPGDIVSLSDINAGRLIFVPDPDENGTGYATFDFSVSDGVLFQTTPNTMTINVNPLQDPPVATDNAIIVAEESTGTPLGLAPPTDVDGDTLTATVTGLPTLGTVFLADGVTPVNNGDTLTVAQLTGLVYNAPTTFTTASAGSFTYDISDGIDTDSGQVDITITPVNDPPLVDLNGAAAGADYTDTFTEGGAPVGITDPTVTVTDEDDTTFPLLKIDTDESTIVDAGQEFLVIGGTDFQLDAATDSLTAVNIGGTSYDVMFIAATAEFIIERTDGGEMTTAQAQAVLAATTYRNDSALPTEADRIFHVCVNDGDDDSNLATSTISVVRDAEAVQFSITGDMMVIDGNNANYTVELSGPIRNGEIASVDLGLTDVDTNSSDYSSFSAAVAAAVAAYSGPGSLAWDGTTLTFTSDGTGAMAPLMIALPTTPDGVFEGDEDLTVSLSNPGSSTGEDVTLAATDSVTTTIKDNTPPPTLMIGDGMATEGDPVVFELTLDVASFEDITFDLATATGSATAGTDFETTGFEFFDGTVWVPATAGTQVTIPAGQTSLMIRIDSVQDGDVEPDETFTLSATVVSGTVTNASDTGTGTIINDDVSLISVDDVIVDEDNGTLTFTISLDQPPTGTVSVDFATASGTATSGVDFVAASGTATFTPGVQTQTVTIAITDDNIFEGPHTFDLNLSNASGGTIVDGIGLGTIVDDGTGPNGSDDDRPVISINDITTFEDVDPFAVFTISLSNPSVEDTVLGLTLANVTAVGGLDYGPGLEFFDGTTWQPVTGNITILAGDTSIQVRTAINDDPIADSGETFTLTATQVSGTTANSGDTGTATIFDDPVPDPTLVSITGPGSVTEGNSATYDIAIDNVPLTDVTVTFVYSGTATGGVDYTGVASVTIPAGSTTATVTIPTIDDTLGEPIENFTITIDSVTGGSLESLQIDPVDFEVTTDIIDDDIPKISVSDVIVTEGFDAFAVFTVELSNPTFEDIDFELSAMGVTADGETVDFGILGLGELEVFDGTNYVPATSATFAPGVTTIQFRTPIIDDVIAEPVETFTVTATVTGGMTCNASATGTGTIQDDTTDPETVLVSLTGPPSVVEGATTTPYTLTLTDPSGLPINAAEDITVTLAYTGVAADGSDFSAVATVLIPQGSGSGTFTLPTVNDSLFEGDEDIIITIDEVTGGGFEGIAADPMADTVTTLIIDDADIPTVSINDVTSIEGTDNFAVYTIELSNLSVEDVDVNLSLAGGTALGGGVDFGATGAGNLQVFDGTTWVDATTATIAAGDMHIQVRTPIVDDNIDEPNENYSLTVDVTAGTTTNIQVIGNGTIIDDDPAPDVTIGDATATEGDQLVFNVTLSNPSSQPIVLDFAAADNSTSGAADFAQMFEVSTDGGATWIAAAGGSEVTIPANSNGVLVRTLTTEDMTLETTETMQLSIASVVSGLVGNTTDTGTGTILDDDTALVSITANDPIAGEPNDNGQFTVSMTNPSDSPTTIAYTVTGPASSGIDFAALSGTITLPAGATSGTIDLVVIDDLIIEGDEDVTIMLTSIISGDADISIDTANDTDTATITDDDEAQWQLTGVPSVNEGAIATYQVDLNGTLQAGESTSVELAITDGTTTPADYASFDNAVAAAVAAYSGPGSLTWDGTNLTFTSDGTGEMAPLVIELMAVNDAIVEGVEQYNVSIANASSATGIAVNIDPMNFSVDTEIQDTIDAVGTSLDKASFSLTGATSVNESQTTDYTITIDATLQAGEDASIDIVLTNDDTTAGDITALNTAVTAAVAAYNSSGQPGSVAWDGTTLTFTSDGTGPMGDLIVQIEATADGFLEGPEDYTLAITNPTSTTGAAVCTDAAMSSVTTTIQPDVTAAVWSIGVDNAGDEGSTVQYTVSLSESFGAGESATVDIGLNDVDTNSSDYANFVAAVNAAVAGYAGPGSLTFDGTTLTFTATADGDSMTDLVIDLMLTDDAIAEGPETFTVDLDNPTGPTGVNVAVDAMADSVTTTINDTMGIAGAPDEVIWSITGPTIGPEGTTVQYNLGLSGALGAGESVSVFVNLNDIDTNGSDYASFAAAVTAAAATDPNVTFDAMTGELTYTAPTDGAMLTPLLIDLGLNTDTIVEGDEDFEIELSGAASSTGVTVGIDPANELVTTTITDTTAPLEWRIVGPAFEDEGGTAQYLILLDGSLGAGETATVEIDLNDLTTNSGDYADILAAVTAAVASDPNVSFDPMTGVLTYAAPADGATLAPIVVDLGITDDVLIEGPEQFEIVLSNPGSTTGAAVQVSSTEGSVTTTINDTQGLGGAADGPAEWSITGDTSVNEGATAGYRVSLSGAFGEDESVSVDLGLSDVDTTSADYANFVAAVNAAVTNYSGPGDVTFDGTTLTFTATFDGDSMDDLIIDLSTIDDTFVEGDEDYTIALSNAATTTAANVAIDTAAQSVTTTIVDNDTATFSITGDPTVSEGANAKYTLTLAGTLQAGETATIELSIGDVGTNSADYANFVAAVNTAIGNYTGPGTLAFDGTTLTFTSDGNPMGDLCIELTAIDDALVEGDEDYTVSIANPGTTTGSDVVTIGPTTVTTTIVDNDTATWSITGDTTVGEGATAQYTVSLDGTLQTGETATIDLGLADVDTNSMDYANFVTAVNTAIAGRTDLVFDGTTLTYTGDGTPMADLIINLAAIDDALIESDEDYTISISNPDSTTGSDVVTGGPTTVTTTITDNDFATWNLTGDPTVNEGATAEYTLSLTGTLQAGESATIDLGLANVDTNSADYANFVTAVNTAIAGRSDLVFDGTTLTYTSDGTPMAPIAINLDAIDDTLVEGNESYTVSIGNSGSSTGSSIAVGTNMVNTIINDNDVAIWSITGDTVVNEGATAQYTVSLAGTLQNGETATIDLGLNDVDTNSADYANFVAAVNAAISGRPELSFDGTTLTFTSIGNPLADVIIDLMSIDDTIAEGTESYTVDIASPGSTTGSSVTGTGIVSTMILDNDALLWSITGDNNVDEGGTASYKIRLAGDLQVGEQASVQLTLSDLETDSADYSNYIAAIQTAVAARSDLSFDAATGILTVTGTGTQMADLCIDLMAVDDAFIEGPERFQLMLGNASSATGLDTGINPMLSLVTTTINDTVGDGGVIEKGVWSLGIDQTVPEGTPAAYTLSLSGNFQSGEIITVNIGLTDLDTTASDYASFDAAVAAAVAGYTGPGSVGWDGTTLTFTSDGTGPMTALPISLDTIDDSFSEGVEDFLIALSNADSMTGAAVCIDATSDTAVTTIDDTIGSGTNDVTFTLVGDTSVDEGGTASYTVGLTGGLGAGESASVDISLSDIDTNSSDYGVINSAIVTAVANYNSGSNPGVLTWDGTTLTFEALVDGDMFAGIQIDLMAQDDGFLEGPEHYQIELTNADSDTGVVAGIAPAARVVVTTINDTDGDGGPPEPGGVWSLVGTPVVNEGDPISYNVNLSGNLQAGEMTTVQLTTADIETNSSDYANFNTAISSAVSAYNADATNPGFLTWDGMFLSFTSDGTGPMNSLDFDVNTVDDVIVEGDERLNVLLSNPSSSTGLTPTISATQSVVTTMIVDNDSVAWSISGDNSVGEGAAAQYTISLDGTLQAGETATIDLGLADVDTNSADYANFVAAVNSAIAGRSDLAFDGTTLTFTSNGSPMANVVIALDAIDDVLIEGNEDYTVSIANPGSTTGSGVATAGSTTVTTTIIDNDAANWSITGDTTVGEGATAQYTLALDGTLQAGQTATIDLGLANVETTSADYANFAAAVNAAIAGRSDLTFDGVTLTYTGDGNPMADVVIELDAIDDSLVEGDENYSISISDPGSTTGSAVATAGTTTVTTLITDNDVAAWSLTGDTAVGEGAIANYVVALSGTLQAGETATIELDIANVDTNSADYANFIAAVNDAVSTRPDLTFDGTTLTYTSDGNPMADLIIELDAIDDALVEGDEDYTVSISTPGSTTGSDVMIGGTTTVTTTITDNDSAVWTITGDATVGEGATATYTVSLDGTLQAGETATIDLGLFDVDTTSADYTNFVAAVNAAIAGRPDLTFDGTTLTHTSNGSPMVDLIIELPTVDDVLVEGDETYSISISNPGSATGADSMVGGSTVVSTTITDNDAAIWSITGDATVAEGAAAQYLVELDGVLQAGETATVELVLSDIDTIGSDHANLAAAVSAAVAAYSGPGTLVWDGTTLTFTSDGTGAMAPLAISLGTVDDGFAEGTEDFQIALGNAGSTTGTAALIDATADDVVTTIDDTLGVGADEVVWSIVGDASVDEGGTAGYIVAFGTGLGAGNTVAVDLSLADIDTNSSDYASFSAAVADAVANHNAGGSDGILAWDGTTLTFTATMDGDTLTGFFIELDAIDDPILEGPEDYVVSLSNAVSSTGVVASIDSVQDMVITTINDTQGDGGPADAGPVWSLTGTTNADEGDAIIYNVELSGNLQAGETASVDLIPSDIDTNSADYSNFDAAIADAVAAYNADPTNSGTLSWDGTTLTFTSDGSGPMDTLEIMVTTVDDPLAEGNESLSLMLGNASSSTGLTPSISATDNEVTTTIVDNDQPVWSIGGPTFASEGNAASFVVSLDGQFQAGEEVSVQIDLTNIDTDSSDFGSFIAAVTAAAAANPDVTFDPATGTLTYVAPTDGATMADLNIDLPITADGVPEAPEDFAITLSNPGSTTGVSPIVDAAAMTVTTTIDGAPVTNPDNFVTSVNTPISGNVLTNDSDPDGGTLMVIAVDGQPIGGPITTDCGMVEINPDGSFIFTPNPGMSGIDTFEYTVVDEAGNEITETVTIVINEPLIGVAKSASAPVPNGDNFDVTFTLFIENLGNVPLSELVLTDDLMANFGSAFVGATSPTISNFAGSGTAPTINGVWLSDTSQNLLVGGLLDVGDSFEVVFTVTLDPDASGMSTELENQAVASGQGLNTDGTPVLDANGDPIVASDVSDNGTDPDGENNEDNNDGVFGNDPTPILIADLGLAKSTIGSPTLLSNGNFELTYQLIVENTGTVAVSGLSLIEDLASQFGAGFVSADGPVFVVPPSGLTSMIALNSGFNGNGMSNLVDAASTNLLQVGDSFTIQFSVEIDLAGLPSADVSNSVVGSGSAVDENGNPITGPNGEPINANDVSDSGTDPTSNNNGQPGDSSGSDDPTPLIIPSIGLAKSAGIPVANGPNFDVTFTILFENNGTVTLTNLTLFDDLASEFGAAFVSVDDLSIENFAGTGTGPAINNAWLNDTTQSIINGGSINAGDSFEIVFTVTIDPDAGGTSGALQNQATATGEAVDASGEPLTDSNGNPLIATDESDNGTNASGENDGENLVDGVFANDPTLIQIADLSIAKTVFGEPAISSLGIATVTYQVLVENTGTVDLTNLSLIEDLASQFGSRFISAGNLQLVSGPSNSESSIVLNTAGWDGAGVSELVDTTAGNFLAIGDSFIIEFTATIDPIGLNGPLENQVIGSAIGVDANGNQLLDSSGEQMTTNDLSDNGFDPNGENGEDNGDGVFANDPTPVEIEIDPAGYFYDVATGEILTGGSIVVTGPSSGSVNLIDAGSDGSYQFFGTEPGRYVIAVTAPPGYTLDTSTLQSGAFDPTGLGNPVLLGSNDLDSNGILDSSAVTPYFLEFDLEADDPAVFLNNLPFILDSATTDGQASSSSGFGGGGGSFGRPFLNSGGPGAFFTGNIRDTLSLTSTGGGSGGYSGTAFCLPACFEEPVDCSSQCNPEIIEEVIEGCDAADHNIVSPISDQEYRYSSEAEIANESESAAAEAETDSELSEVEDAVPVTSDLEVTSEESVGGEETNEFPSNDIEQRTQHSGHSISAYLRKLSNWLGSDNYVG